MDNIYIDLDSLLDTRLGLFMDISPKLAGFIYSHDFITRYSDNFPLMNYLEFKDRYTKRNRDFIKIPLPTMIISLLEIHTLHLSQKNILRGGDGLIKLYLNLYPYEFSKHEELLIVSGIKSKLLDRVNVIPVYDENLSVGFIKDNIDTIIMYDGIDWVERNVKSGKLKEKVIPYVEMIVPDVIHTPESITTNKDEILSNIATIFLPFIDLTFVAVGLFSTHIKIEK